MVRIKVKPVKSLPQTVTANGVPKYSIYVLPQAIERKNSISEVCTSIAEQMLRRRNSFELRSALINDHNLAYHIINTKSSICSRRRAIPAASIRLKQQDD